MTPSLKEITLQGEPIRPSKIVCVGRNYAEHIEELGNEIPDEMVLFVKPNSAIADELLASSIEPIHFESELSFLVQDQQFVAVAFGLDLTKRELQSSLKEKGLPWARAKSFDGAAVFGDFIPIAQNWSELRLELRVNYELKQQGGVEQMLHKPFEILEEIQSFMTLNDGDIVMTGTPKGVGALERERLYEGSLFNADELLAESQWIAR